MAKTKKPESRGLVPVQTKQELVITQPGSDALTGFLSGNTKRAYARDIMDFFRIGDLSKLTMARAKSVTPQEVAAFRDKLLADGKKPATVQRKLSALRSVYNYLMTMGAITVNPAHPKLVRAPKKPSVRKTDIITWDDAIRILNSVDRSNTIGRRDYTLLFLSLNLGTRRSELLKIQLDDMKHGPEGDYVYIKGKGEKERFIYLRPDVKTTIDEYMKDRGPDPGPLFPGRKKELDGSQFWRIVKNYAEKAGLKDIHPHSLRAAFITLAHQKGVPIADIQKTVGHSRGETTLSYARDLEMIKSSATKALTGLTGEDNRTKK
jgi:site-specific recombinase XerD